MAAANVLRNEQQQTIHITTNLYELITAVAGEVRPDEDSLVKHVVLRLLEDCGARLESCRSSQARLTCITRHRPL